MKLFTLPLIRSSRLIPTMLGIAVLSMLAGCESTGGDYSYVRRISTGEKKTFPLKNGQPILAHEGTITVRMAGLNRVPGKELVVLYEFGYEDTSGANPKSVQVDDVTDTDFYPLVDAKNPELKNKFWTGVSKPLDAGAPELSWLPYLDNTTRIFRFKVTKADGTEVVLYQAWFVPAFVKMGVRMALGMKN